MLITYFVHTANLHCTSISPTVYPRNLPGVYAIESFGHDIEIEGFNRQEVVMAGYQWRGGVGITFGSPSRWIPDVAELGYEISWGVEDNPAEVASILGIAIFRYWNSIVEVTLKDPDGAYDFSNMDDKQEAAKRAFDAWASSRLGIEGLSQYAEVEHKPDGSYGDVMGTMDYESDNPLVSGLVEDYLQWFEENRVMNGGIALDNAGKIPEQFVRTLRKRMGARGLGIATNGCPDEYLPMIDFFGNEGFPFTIPRAKEARSKGFSGIFGEFTMQHLSGGELEAYLRAKQFNRIVFFGYTNGGVAAGARHSSYVRRPDVYDHQRWVFRKYVPMSRAVIRAGEQREAFADLLESRSVANTSTASSSEEPTTRGDGAVFEWDRKYDVRQLIDASIGEPFVTRFGSRFEEGIYLYVGSADAEEAIVDANALGISAEAIANEAVVWDEFEERILPVERSGEGLSLCTTAGPALLQIGPRRTIVRNLLNRIQELFREQLRPGQTQMLLKA